MTMLIQAAIDNAVIPPLWRILTKFAYFLGLAVVMGSSIVHVCALRPALRGGADDTDRRVLRRRSAFVMAWAGVVLLLALYPQLAGKAARANDGMSFSSALDPSVVWDYVTVPKPDDVWVSPALLILITYVLFAASGGLAVLLFAEPVRRHVDTVASVLAPLIVIAQCVTIVPGTLEGTSADSWTMTVMGYAHPIAACTWVGGVIALVALAGARSRLTNAAGPVWARIWRRFSVVAEVCVGIVLVSGLWLGWKSVGGISQLWETPYGRFLVLKVTLVFTLIGFGAFNEFVLLPRIARLRAEGDTRSVFRMAVGHFPRVVAIEAAIGVAVLSVVPFLNGSAREQAGGAAEPPATGAIVTAVLVLLAIVVASFVVNLRLHERIDNPVVPEAELADAPR